MPPIYFIHQMVIQNATKLLPLTIQTKLTLTVTLTLTDTVTVIFYMHFVDTHKRYHINKRNFSRRSVAGFVGGPIFCTTQQPVCYTVMIVFGTVSDFPYTMTEVA